MNSFVLHILAMLFMLVDHLWATVVSGNMWMNFVGRLAFPIFAFMIAEGFYYTHNIKKYLKRMFIFALISEIPFNLMNSGSVVDPFHQNVMWTFLLALICMTWVNKCQGQKYYYFKGFGITLLFTIISMIGMTDYMGVGILTVMLFYFTHSKNWKNMLIQLIGIYIINFVLIQNMDIPFILFGHEFFFPTQGFAILSLIPIWLYNGKQGPHNKYIQYAFYLFYPLHILILSLMAIYL